LGSNSPALRCRQEPAPFLLHVSKQLLQLLLALLLLLLAADTFSTPLFTSAVKDLHDLCPLRLEL
jgi:hypothetical protein